MPESLVGNFQIFGPGSVARIASLMQRKCSKISMPSRVVTRFGEYLDASGEGRRHRQLDLDWAGVAMPVRDPEPIPRAALMEARPIHKQRES